MLKSSILTITVPYEGCDKNCPYCVSRMTGHTRKNLSAFNHNMIKAKKVAETANVNSVLLTGKGEPLLNIPAIYQLAKYFNEWPIELQTNGLQLMHNPGLIGDLEKHGLNILAISIDNYKDLHKFSEVFELANSFGMIVRVTINVSDRFRDFGFKQNILPTCRSIGVHQLMLRKITAPSNAIDSDAVEWIQQHDCEKHYDRLVQEAYDYIVQEHGEITPIRTTSQNMKVYDCNGISFVHSDYCIQEQNKDDEIRSLIYCEDGHMYTTWNSQASILF